MGVDAAVACFRGLLGSVIAACASAASGTAPTVPSRRVVERPRKAAVRDQERALAKEPGFNGLTPETQQKLTERLRQLNRMSALQRQRTLDRIEAMEHLDPQRRQEVRNSVQEFRTLPVERQRLLRKTFRELRVFPPAQREVLQQSGEFQGQFSGRERTVLHNLLAIEPYRASEEIPAGNGAQTGR